MSSRSNAFVSRASLSIVAGSAWAFAASPCWSATRAARNVATDAGSRGAERSAPSVATDAGSRGAERSASAQRRHRRRLPAQTPPTPLPFVPASTPEQERFGSFRRSGIRARFISSATMDTTQWGWFNNAQPPVLNVKSGDTIVFETMMHSHNQVVPGTTIEQIKKLRTDFPGRGPHTLTGPVYIEGAEPGDVLKVRINKIVPRAYGTNFNVPGMFGQFPGKFPEGQVKYFYLDLDRKIAEFAPGIEIPLAPFPGTIGVARAEPGQYSSVPRADMPAYRFRDLTEGAALYVPVFVKGALLWTGDSHAAQGKGRSTSLRSRRPIRK